MPKEKTSKKIISIALFIMGISSIFIVYIAKIDPPSIFYAWKDIFIGTIVAVIVGLIVTIIIFREEIDANNQEKLITLQLQLKDKEITFQTEKYNSVVKALEERLRYLQSKK